MCILVTGSNGFVGQHLVKRLESDKYSVRKIVRRNARATKNEYSVGDINWNTDWNIALKDINTVVHAAARVHIMNDTAMDPMQEFRKVNVDGTLKLARESAAAGVSRFVYISSVKVCGESTTSGFPYRENVKCAPTDPYAISKLEAEQGLRMISENTGMEIVIIRPPLVYGPGAKANILNMMRWLKRGIPLPLGSIRNRRSLVSLDNLVDFILICIKHPSAANQTFLVSDGEDLSTSELLRRMAKALGVPARLVPVPATWLKLGANLVGLHSIYQRLGGSLQVDIEKARSLLGWTPPYSVDESLAATTQHFLSGIDNY